MRPSKILYISCHAVLEYDELRMFRDEGYRFFSVGAYQDPEYPSDNSRQPLHNCSLVSSANEYYQEMVYNNQQDKTLENVWWGKTFSKKFLDLFDIIIVMHVPDVLIRNRHVFAGRKVIWRTIGQSTKDVETRIAPLRREGWLKTVRYSPFEKKISAYSGHDAIIRFAKYKEDFKSWTGEKRQIITVGQAMKRRGWYCNYDTFKLATSGFPAKIYGRQAHEEDDLSVRGKEFNNYGELIDTLSKNAAYFYTGTRPASYTLNFMEACLAGIPIISIGSKLSEFLGEEYLEVPDLLQRYGAGYSSNAIYELRFYIQKILEDRKLQEEFSTNVRRLGVEEFDAQKIRSQWTSFLESL